MPDPNPEPDDPAVHEQTDSPTYADDRMFYKVEKWTRDRTKVDSLLYAGNSLGRARSVFAAAIKHRPRIRLTIRQQTRVLDHHCNAITESRRFLVKILYRFLRSSAV